MLLKHYLDRGVSKAELSRRFGVNRRTIHNWVDTGQLDRDLAAGARGYSRLLWLRFYTRQTMPVLMEGLESAVDRFGGVPEELLFDQMRAVVLSDDRGAGGGLVLNEEFLRFAAHWGFMPRSCRP